MIYKYIPGKKQQSQLSPCYIQQRMMDGDQHFVISEVTRVQWLYAFHQRVHNGYFTQ